MSKKDAAEKLKQAVEDVLQEVVKEDATERIPGMILDAGKLTTHKLPYKRSDLERIYPMLTFTPEETIPITLQGITYQLEADKPITVPSAIKDIYDNYRKSRRQSAGVLMTAYGPVNVQPGVGALEPEPTREV